MGKHKRKKCKPVPEEDEVSLEEGECPPTPPGLQDNEDKSLLTPRMYSDAWELLEIDKLLADPFLNAQRRVYYSDRRSELKDVILEEFRKGLARLPSADETATLERLYVQLENDEFPAEKRDEVSCICNALQDKITQTALDNSRDDSLQKLNHLLLFTFISESNRRVIVDNLNRLTRPHQETTTTIPKKTKKNDFITEDSVRILYLIKKLLDNPFMDHDKRLSFASKLKKLVPSGSPEEDVYASVERLIRDPELTVNAQMKLYHRMETYKKNIMNGVKSEKQSLRAQLMQTTDGFVMFNGTNLDFIDGYGVTEPEFVRCVNVWHAVS